jgi:hypothetical protein
MFKWFIIHQWKSAKRSSIWQKNLVLNIFIGFLAVIMLSYLVLLGFVLDKMLLEIVKDKDPENVLSGILIFYFLVNFTLRFFYKVFLPCRPFLICTYLLSEIHWQDF